MSLKNRIRKIEKELSVDSEFCRCPREIVIKIKPRGERDESPPETCQDCGKKVDRSRTFNFNDNIKIRRILPSCRMIESGNDVQRNQQ